MHPAFDVLVPLGFGKTRNEGMTLEEFLVMNTSSAQKNDIKQSPKTFNGILTAMRKELGVDFLEVLFLHNSPRTLLQYRTGNKILLSDAV